jgi:hypothetical protein
MLVGDALAKAVPSTQTIPGPKQINGVQAPEQDGRVLKTPRRIESSSPI